MSLVPELRFPEFKDEWRENKLEEIIEEVKSKNNDNAPLFSLIIEKGLIPKTDKYKREFLVKDKKNAYVTIFKNQFAYNPMNVRFGAIARLKNIEKAKVSKYYNIFQCKHNCNPVFLEYFLLHPNRIKLYNKVAIGSLLEKRRIHFNDFLKLKMKLPTLPEQQKIANFLSAIDDKIELQTKKIEQLEKYKKGIIQKLFNGEIRFPEFKDEWRDVKLGEIGTTYTGLKGKTKKDFGNKGKPFIQYKQVFENSEINSKNFAYVHIAENEKQNTVKYGDVLFTISSETPHEVGFASVFLSNIPEVYLNSFCFGFRANPSILYPLFSKYIFRHKEFRKNVIKLAQGSTRYNISKSEMMKIKIKLPSLPEQQKIANFLNAIDDKIELEKKKLEQIKAYKKGLMQKMFI